MRFRVLSFDTRYRIKRQAAAPYLLVVQLNQQINLRDLLPGMIQRWTRVQSRVRLWPDPCTFSYHTASVINPATSRHAPNDRTRHSLLGHPRRPCQQPERRRQHERLTHVLSVVAGLELHAWLGRELQDGTKPATL